MQESQLKIVILIILFLLLIQDFLIRFMKIRRFHLIFNLNIIF